MIEPLPPEETPDESASLSPARRRRQRRSFLGSTDTERDALLLNLSQQAEPTFDFFLFTLLAGLVLGAGFYFDSPHLVVLGALLAPLLTPVFGAALGIIAGSGRYTLQSLGSLLISSVILFVCGVLSGWLRSTLTASTLTQTLIQAYFPWGAVIAAAVGAWLTADHLLQGSKKPLIVQAALTYTLYPPVVAAGFAAAAHLEEPWWSILSLPMALFAWAVLVTVLTLVFYRFLPKSSKSYWLMLVFVFIILTFGFLLPGGILTSPTAFKQPPATATLSPSQTPSPIPTQADTLVPTAATRSPSATAAKTATRTLVTPSRTPTLTITPTVTPQWARVYAQAGNGVLVREEPDYNAVVLQSLLNGTLVEILPEERFNENTTWVRIRTAAGKEGWVVRALLTTATPLPPTR